jgi:hypothetical protein
MWRVADGPTADFVRRFQHFLARSEGWDEVLRHTKLRFLHGASTVAHRIIE